MIHEIVKRDGSVVPFDATKITIVMRKALTSTKVPVTDELLQQMTDRVVARLDMLCESDPACATVEKVQDLVEQTLMERGDFDTAKHFILYRYQASEKRKDKVIEAIEDSRLTVTRTDGTKEQFSRNVMIAYVQNFVKGYESEIDVKAIVTQLEREIFDGIKTRDLAKLVTLILRARIEEGPAYAYVAGRQLNAQTVEEVLDIPQADERNTKAFDKKYRAGFAKNIKKMVDAKRLDKALLDFDLERLALAIEPQRDDLFAFMGIETLSDRYFISAGGKQLEVPQTMLMRIAMGLALGDAKKERNDRAIEYYNVMSTLRFVPSTPTLFHAGTVHPQLSSCYLNDVSDDLNHIFKVYGDNAQMSKWAGGIGTSWSKVRATGAMVKTAEITSQGVIPYLKIANDVCLAINRSGRRRGATAVYLENWHYDFPEFLELRKNTGDERRRTHDLNTATWVSDLFMKRVQADGEWTLFSPDETPELTEVYGKKFEEIYQNYEKKADAGDIKLFTRVKARDLWKKMLGMLFETGHPWITFKDPSNIRSPQDHVGVIHHSNLCTEIMLNTSEDETAVCNLGSVNYPMHITGGKLDEAKIRETVRTAMRMLDNVVDINFYPTIEGKNSNMRHRPVGLGVMGFHDALYMLDIVFDSEQAVKFADTSMEIIAHSAILASTELAEERGAYESFKGSKWDRGILPVDTIALLEEERGMGTGIDRTETQDWATVRDRIKKYGMRNSNCMAIAPTATISNIAGSVPGIEPIYKNIYVKSNISGDFIVINTYLVEALKKEGLWTKEMREEIKLSDGSIKNIASIPMHIREMFKETFEIDMRWLVRHAAQRGKRIDQPQSLNIFYAGTSGKDISDLYLYAWELGLKTTYYLRTLGATQVEKATSGEAGTQTRKKAESNMSQAEPAVATPAATTETADEGNSPSSAIATAVTPSASSNSSGLAHSNPSGQAKPNYKLHVAEEAICESCQ